LGEETNGFLSQEKKQSFFDLVGVRDSQNQAIAGVSLLLTSSLREEEQGRSRFLRLFQSSIEIVRECI
jgi:hypothetical protein